MPITDEEVAQAIEETPELPTPEPEIKAIVPFVPMTLLREPSRVLAEAQKAARVIMQAIKDKPKPVIIGGEIYPEFEDWQMMGAFYGLSVKTGEAKPVWVGDAMGYEAKAEIIDKRGKVVAAAEAMCMNDEERWSNKPLFQLRSMAQTRAAAKAFRNCLSWNMALGGAKTTPAEEITDVKKVTPPPAMSGPGYRDESSETNPVPLCRCGLPAVQWRKGNSVRWYCRKGKDDPSKCDFMQVDR